MDPRAPASSLEPNPRLCTSTERSKQKALCCLSTAPSAPGSVKFSELTTTSVNVSWDAPQFPNGPLEGYRLVYEPCTPVDGKWGDRPRGLNASPFKGWFAPRDHTVNTTPQLDVVRIFLSYKRGD